MSATALGLGLALPFRSAGGFSPLSLFAGGTVQGAWYDPSDSTTLFTDRAGTTPCGTPGGGSVVPVGLMLDKSQGLVLGTNIQNGGFDTDTVWTKNGWVISGGTASYASGAGAAIEQASPVTLSAGDLVKVTVTVSAITTGFVYVLVAGTVTSALGISATRTNAAGTYTWYFPIATVINQNVGIYCGNGPTGVVIDNLSIQKVAGNHAIAANDTTSRPELRARVNLLTYSEQFDNAAWAKSNVTATANTSDTTAPDGTNTADKILESGVNYHDLLYSFSQTSGVVYRFSVYVKGGLGRDACYIYAQNTTGGGAAVAKFNLNTGAYLGSGGGALVPFTTYGSESAGNGWFRIFGTYTASSTAAHFLAISLSDNTGPNINTYTGDPTKGMYVWGAQLTATNEFPANTYQRISDANTYDAVGFPRYLVANGTSSAMSTPGNVNLSGTDKVTVFAGVRKLSAAVRGMLVELSATAANQGAFNVCAPEAADDYSFTLTGNAGSPYYQPAGYAAPISNVVSCGYDFAGALRANEIVPRINGVLAQSGGAGTSAGTNTAFLNAPLNIGARNNGASIFFNGNIYSLIVVGSAVSAGNITSTEQWVAGKVGITI